MRVSKVVDGATSVLEAVACFGETVELSRAGYHLALKLVMHARTLTGLHLEGLIVVD